MFYPGETDYHTFTLPFPAGDIGSTLISYKQKGRVVIEKAGGTPEAVEDEVCRVSLSLTQQDT